MFKKWLSCFILVLCCFTTSTHAAYFNEIDFDALGTISLSFDEKINSGEFTLYQVGTLDKDGNSLGFNYTEDFQNDEMSLDNLKAEGLVEYLTQLASHSNKGMRANCDQGRVEWKDLDLGLYLVVQSKQADGYYMIDPFLVSLPLENEINKEWMYDIDASPKMETLPSESKEIDLTVKKVWVNDNKNKRPSNITVILYKNNVEVERIQLNEKNNWQHLWKQLDDQYNWTIKEIVPKDYVASYTYSGHTIILTNTYELPNTGQLQWPIPVLAITGIVLFSMGWYLTFMKKEKKHEE